jgi:hypothetical protein
LSVTGEEGDVPLFQKPLHGWGVLKTYLQSYLWWARPQGQNYFFLKQKSFLKKDAHSGKAHVTAPHTAAPRATGLITSQVEVQNVHTVKIGEPGRMKRGELDWRLGLSFTAV